jgi:hypothetical protein
MRFVIHFCEDHFSREKRDESSLFIQLQLRDDVDDFIIKRIRFQFDEKFRVEMSQNESIFKNVFELIKRLSRLVCEQKRLFFNFCLHFFQHI